jgi:hypothetical protein
MIINDDQGRPINFVGFTPTVINKALTNGNEEYNVELPISFSRFTLQARTAADVKLCYTVGESGSKYITVKSGSSYSEDSVGSVDTPHKLYMQSASAGTVVEIIIWS